MPEAKKILITTESHEFLIVRELSLDPLSFCPQCDPEARLMTLDEAVTFERIGTRKLLALLDRGTVHSVETPSGHLLVCQNSLRNYSQARYKKEVSDE